MSAAALTRYEDPRAHAAFGGTDLPVPVEAIAEDLFGLSVEESWELGTADARVGGARPAGAGAGEGRA